MTTVTSATVPDDGDDHQKKESMAQNSSKLEAGAVPSVLKNIANPPCESAFQSEENIQEMTLNKDEKNDDGDTKVFPTYMQNVADQLSEMNSQFLNNASGTTNNAKPEMFHGLTLLKKIGEGGFGEVWYCEDLSGQKKALKRIKQENCKQAELKGLTNYRKIMDQSPELLKIESLQTDNEYFYYLMEPADSTSTQDYVPDTLANRLKHGPLPQKDVLDILNAVFSCIRILHNADLAHRDIKPDNILFVKGKPKLGDIGLMSDLTQTKKTRVVGTDGYLPPEAYSTNSPSKEQRLQWDLYAFGKVIYQVFTGEMDAKEWPTIPENVALNTFSSKLNDLSAKLCDRDPSKRMYSIEEIEVALDKLKKIELEYFKSMELSQGKAKYKKRFWGLLGIAFLEAITILFLVMKQGDNNRTEPVISSDPILSDEEEKEIAHGEDLYCKGDIPSKGEAFSVFKKYADHGIPRAQYDLGRYYEDDSKDKEKSTSKQFRRNAFELYKMAAEKKYIEAQYALGMCYHEGIGTEKNNQEYTDDDEAFYWWRTAAEFGNHAQAQYEVGQLYEAGRGPGQNLKEAFKWFQKAADNGLSDAQYMLATIYAGVRHPKVPRSAYGIEKDDAKANDYYFRAAEQGHTEARGQIVAKFPGIQITGVTMQDKTNIIKSVVEKTAADTGLRGDDKIVQIDSKEVKTKDDIDYLLLSYDHDKKVFTKKESVKLRTERNREEEIELPVK